jgi:hypothetical protein
MTLADAGCATTAVSAAETSAAANTLTLLLKDRPL